MGWVSGLLVALFLVVMVCFPNLVFRLDERVLCWCEVLGLNSGVCTFIRQALQFCVVC